MPSLRVAAVALAALTACAGSSAQDPQAPSSSPSAPRRFRFPLERPRADLIEGLDRTVQARFRDVDEEIQDNGPSRYAALRIRVPHGILRKDLQEFVPLLETVRAEGWAWATYVAAVGRNGVRDVVGPIVENEESLIGFVDRDRVRPVAAEATRTRAAVQAEVGGLPLEARPIVASSEKCLSCHRRRRLGDPIGVLVHAFRNTRAWIP